MSCKKSKEEVVPTPNPKPMKIVRVPVAMYSSEQSRNGSETYTPDGFGLMHC